MFFFFLNNDCVISVHRSSLDYGGFYYRLYQLIDSLFDICGETRDSHEPFMLKSRMDIETEILYSSVSWDKCNNKVKRYVLLANIFSISVNFI